MRADEPINVDSLNEILMVSGCCNYINKLRYERMMAKAMYFGILAYHYACEGDKKDSAKSKCDRLYRALEARARKIKEGM